MKNVRFVALLAVLPLACLGTGVGNPSQESSAIQDTTGGDAYSDIMSLSDTGSDIIGIDVVPDFVVLDASMDTGVPLEDVEGDPGTLLDITEETTPWPDIDEGDAACCDDAVTADVDGDAQDAGDAGDLGDMGDAAWGQ